MNFVIHQKELFYIDYEVSSYSGEWNFENWGLYYWLNPEGVSHFLETGSADKLNKPGVCKPLSNENIEDKRRILLSRYLL
jgi:hypothetical protein